MGRGGVGVGARVKVRISVQSFVLGHLQSFPSRSTGTTTRGPHHIPRYILLIVDNNPFVPYRRYVNEPKVTVAEPCCRRSSALKGKALPTTRNGKKACCDRTRPICRTTCHQLPAGRWSDWSRLSFRPPGLFRAHATKTRREAARLPMPTLSPPKGWG